ncbi:unnamed protein product [Meloidogyne enterolobii]|uniref:Uncharacterized protein n=1 Tax=Meloidogyne enterolobii TaxID=390850 RepID=A0ACB0YPF4_MELEN
MCISRIGQIIYGGLTGITIALICASMFTPGWRRLTLHVNDSFNSLKEGNPSAMQNITNMNFGIFLCQIPNPQQQSSSPNSLPLSDNNSPKEENEDSWKKSLNYCEQWFKLRSDWEKVVIIAMILAFLLSLIAFILNFFSFCSCACRLSILMRPLPLLAGLTFICLVVGLGLFWIKNQDYIAQIKIKVNDLDIDSLKSSAVDVIKFVNNLDEKTTKGGNKDNQGNVDNKVSYSFYLGCGAAVAAFANIVVGSLIVCFA